MSDTRFTILGIGLIFAGFIVLTLFGAEFYDASLEAEQFGTCFDYSNDKAPVPIDCDIKLQGKSVFFGIAVGLVGAGIASLIKGVRGKWDQDVKPEDMVGPGGPGQSGSSGPNDSSSDKPD